MFNPTRLAVARMRNGLTMTALAEKVGMSQRSLSGYEGGTVPPHDVLQKIANVLNYPIDFFLRDDLHLPKLDAVSFRAQSKMSAVARDLAVSQGSLAFEFNKWIEERFDLPAAQLPDLSQEADPEAAAVSVRQTWGLGEAPIPHLIALLESKGVRVFSLAVDSLTVDAYSTWLDETPFIFLNTMKSAERTRFDAAHELAHLVMHRHALKDNARIAEDEANRCASAFLMPRHGTLARAPRFVTVQSLIEHKKHWLVSVAALNERLHVLGVTNDWQHRHLAAEISKRGYRKNEPEPGVRESSRLLSKVLNALREEELSRSDLAAALAFPKSEVERLVFGLTLTGLDGGKSGVDPTPATKSRPDLLLVK